MNENIQLVQISNGWLILLPKQNFFPVQVDPNVRYIADQMINQKDPFLQQLQEPELEIKKQNLPKDEFCFYFASLKEAFDFLEFKSKE